MISTDLARAAERLLAGGASQREVARQLGISRGTVATVAAGQWTGYARAADKQSADEPLAPPVRCARCGGLVHPPCRLCRLREQLRRRRVRASWRQRLAQLPAWRLRRLCVASDQPPPACRERARCHRQDAASATVHPDDAAGPSASAAAERRG
jgi:hypothetical protein